MQNKEYKNKESFITHSDKSNILRTHQRQWIERMKWEINWHSVVQC